MEIRFDINKQKYWQSVRGLCILAVVMIHVLSTCTEIYGYSVAITVFRQLLNFGVPIFIFMAGYFTNPDKACKIQRFWLMRGGYRLLLPYLIWSLVYSVCRRLSLKETFMAIITGGAFWQFYYIIVLLQLVLLTPILIKVAQKNLDIWIYIIWVFSILFDYCLNLEIINVKLPFQLCFSFIPFYYLGIKLRLCGKAIRCSKKALGFFVVMTFLLSCVEAVILYRIGYYSVAFTQKKISSWLYAFSLCVLFVKIFSDYSIDNEKDRFIMVKSFLEMIGDCSYGIFYSHCLFLIMLGKLLTSFCESIHPVLYIVIIYIIVSLVSFIFCNVINKLMGKRVSKLFGII